MGIVRDAKLKLLASKWTAKLMYREDDYLKDIIDAFQVKYNISDDDYMQIVVAIAVAQDKELSRKVEAQNVGT